MKTIEKSENVIDSKKADILYPNIFTHDGYIVIEEKVKEAVTLTKVANSIRIKSVLENIDTGEIFFELEFSYNGSSKTLIVPRGQCLIKRELLQLQKQGVDVLESNATLIMQHLNNEEREASVKRIHSKLGFAKHEDKLVFKHYKAIGLDSVYNGNLKIEPHGNYEVWESMIDKHVLGNIPLETNLMVGLSSALVAMIGSANSIDTLIIHKCGNSTSGKTTGSRLAISPWGYPDSRENGLFTTWNSTANPLLSNLNGNCGLAVVLDEISMSDGEDFTKLIYRLAGGVDKKRLNKDSTLKESGKWSSTFESNGEFSILTKSKKNDGIRMRVIEFKNVDWTKDAESADEIKDTCINNYGHAGIKFAEKLLNLGIDKIQRIYKKETDKITNQLREEGINDNFVSRRAYKLALLSTTAKIAKVSLGIDFHVKEITKFLISNEKESSLDRNIEQTAYEHFLQQYAINEKKFIKNRTKNGKTNHFLTKSDSIETWGTYIDNKGRKVSKPDEICIYPDIFRRIMSTGGYEDEKIILKQWKELGILDCEEDRYTRKRKLGSTGSRVHVYVVKVLDKKSGSSDSEQATANLEDL